MQTMRSGAERRRRASPLQTAEARALGYEADSAVVSRRIASHPLSRRSLHVLPRAPRIEDSTLLCCCVLHCSDPYSTHSQRANRLAHNSRLLHVSTRLLDLFASLAARVVVAVATRTALTPRCDCDDCIGVGGRHSTFVCTKGGQGTRDRDTVKGVAPCRVARSVADSKLALRAFEWRPSRARSFRPISSAAASFLN